MEHDAGVNKLQLHLGASDYVSSILPLASEQMSPLLSNEREGSEDIQQVNLIELFLIIRALMAMVFFVSISFN